MAKLGVTLLVVSLGCWGCSSDPGVSSVPRPYLAGVGGGSASGGGVSGGVSGGAGGALVVEGAGAADDLPESVPIPCGMPPAGAVDENGVITLADFPDLVGDASLAVDRESLYWSTRGTCPASNPAYDPNRPCTPGMVRKVSICGGPAASLVEFTQNVGGPSALLVDGDSVYFSAGYDPATSGDSLRSVPVAGGPPTVLVSGLNPSRAIASDGPNLYFIDNSRTAFQQARVLAVPKKGGGFRSVADPVGSVDELAVHASILFLRGAHDISRVAITGGNAVQLETAPSIWAFTSDKSALFWFGDTGDGSGAIQTVPLAGGSTSVLARPSETVGPMAVDARDLYFVAGREPDNSGEPALWRMPRGGGSATRIATLPSGALVLKLDASFVYWVTGSGRVQKIEK